MEAYTLSRTEDFTSSGDADVARGNLISGPVKFTQVKKTLSILFREAKASLGNIIGRDEPLSATWVGAISVAAEMLGGTEPAMLAQQLRGSVHKDEQSRIVLSVNLSGDTFLSGQTHTFEFPFDERVDEDFEREFTDQSGLTSFRVFTATIIVSIERRDPKSLAELTVDSFDVVNQAP
jgi:hypothetical protein